MARNSPPITLGRSSFVGREQELATLSLALKQASDGRPQVVLLSGEPGVGKSTLVRQFLSIADSEGW